MSKKDQKALLSHFKNLMMHIVKWLSQEKKRSKSWKNTINNSRQQISNIQKNTPSLTDKFIEENWDKTFDKAKKDAEKEMKKKSKTKSLTWEEVFVNKYTLIIAFIIAVSCFIYY